jgi:hypothetical protein
MGLLGFSAQGFSAQGFSHASALLAMYFEGNKSFNKWRYSL